MQLHIMTNGSGDPRLLPQLQTQQRRYSCHNTANAKHHADGLGIPWLIGIIANVARI